MSILLSISVGSFQPVLPFETGHLDWLVTSLNPVYSFEALGPLRAAGLHGSVWSFQPVGSFEPVGSFKPVKPVKSSEVVWPFEAVGSFDAVVSSQVADGSTRQRQLADV